MIPTGGQIDTKNTADTEQPSLTWYLDIERGRVVGKVDELTAVQQATFKIVQSERFRHLIYSSDYGAELSSLIGKSPVLVQSELKRRIREALLQDDRINDVINFNISFSGDTATASFTVVSLFGSYQQEVRTNV